jgi:hypothetical protein
MPHLGGDLGLPLRHRIEAACDPQKMLRGILILEDVEEGRGVSEIEGSGNRTDRGPRGWRDRVDFDSIACL